VCDKFLLTGAGFTKNFGGFLASEMWSRIFSHAKVQAIPHLRSALLADMDYESVYYCTLNDEIREEVEAIVEATRAAYADLDNVLSEYSFTAGSPYPVNIYKVQKLIGGFAGKRGKPGFIFTLNQDLFLERHYYNGPRPLLPGVSQQSDFFSSNSCASPAVSRMVDVGDATTLAEARVLLEKHHELAYLKLHGSSNWQAAGSPSLMVLGRDKIKAVDRDPLLSWYLETFRNCISSNNARILVIGYGFGDAHINDLLAEAATSCNLGIYIWDPTQPGDLLERIRKQQNGAALLQGIKAIYSTPMREVFPADQSETVEWRRIQDQFFERVIV
jgi:hypothetical protein